MDYENKHAILKFQSTLLVRTAIVIKIRFSRLDYIQPTLLFALFRFCNFCPFHSISNRFRVNLKIFDMTLDLRLYIVLVISCDISILERRFHFKSEDGEQMVLIDAIDDGRLRRVVVDLGAVSEIYKIQVESELRLICSHEIKINTVY